jgi:hypothetical protein
MIFFFLAEAGELFPMPCRYPFILEISILLAFEIRTPRIKGCKGKQISLGNKINFKKGGENH